MAAPGAQRDATIGRESNTAVACLLDPRAPLSVLEQAGVRRRERREAEHDKDLENGDGAQPYARRMRASSSTVRSAVGFASKRSSGIAVPLSIEIP